MLDSIRQDIRHAFRSLRRSPGFALTAVASLAFCIAGGAVVFGVVNVLLGGAKPVARIDRLVDVFTNVRDAPYQTSSYPDYVDLRARTIAFDDVVASGPVLVALNPGGGTRLVIGEATSGNLFSTLGVGVALGRPIEPHDDRPGADRVVVLSYGLWRREFGGRPDVLGHTVHIRRQPYTIVGVASESMTGMNVFPAQLWVPLTWIGDHETMGITDFVASPGTTPLERRGERWLFLKGRLKDGQTIDTARADLRGVMNQLEAEYPASNKGRRFSAVRTADVRVHPMADAGLAAGAGALTVLVGLLLLVACANITGLQLARATARMREVSIRLALGASRPRIVRHLLTEMLLLSCTAGGLAIALVWGLMTSLSGADLALPIPLSFDGASAINAHLLWFALLTSIAAGIVAGLTPALNATRSGQTAGLRHQALMATVYRRRWSLRDGVIVIQTAAAVVLLVAASLLTRSVLAAGRIDIGFSPAHVSAFNTGTGTIGYDSDRAQRFYADALQQIAALPEVDTASLTWRTPFDLTFAQDPILLMDRHTSNDQVIPTERTIVSPEYFSTLGVRLLEGRNFTAADTLDRPRVAIVNQTMARRYWPNGDAIGQRFRVRALDGPEYEIVGISSDYKVRTVGEAPTPYVHYAASQWRTNDWTVLVKARANSTVSTDAVRRVFTALDADVLFRATSLDAKVATVLLPTSASAVALGLAGTLAILFAAIGLYGIVAFMVAQRTNEFGLRLALGALPRQVMGMVLRRGLTVVATGTAVGVLLAIAAALAVERVLYGISAADPIAWIVSLAIVAAVSGLAHAVPARRAASVNPVDALKAE
jgi:predicted permease